jgi:hypothetical protein
LFLAPSTGDFGALTFAGAMHKAVDFPRYAQILNACWREAIALGSGIAHPAVSLALLAGCLGIASRQLDPLMRASLAVLLAVALGYFLAYVVTPVDLTWHLSTSLGRLYLQLWPIVIFLALLVLRRAEETAIVAELPRQKAARASGKKGRKARVG